MFTSSLIGFIVSLLGFKNLDLIIHCICLQNNWLGRETYSLFLQFQSLDHKINAYVYKFL